MTYTQSGRKLQTSTIEKAIRKSIADMKGKDYCRKEYSELKDADDSDIQYWARSLKGLNDALIDGRSVFAVCDKMPRNLDSGSHHYSIFYVTKDGRVSNFWMGKFMLVIGGGRNKIESGLRHITFSSGAIGMSRVLAATDGVFNFLRRIGGCYAQIDVI